MTDKNNIADQDIVHWLKQIQVGDEAALVALHEKYINPVYSVSHRILGNAQDAEEVAQDVFMRLWDQAETYDPDKGSFITWLLTITRRLAIDHLRKRERRTPDDEVSMDKHPYLWETLQEHGDTTDLQRTLLSTLSELPFEQREVIKLAYFKGMSHTEMAEFLQRPLGTVKSQLRLGMQKLRDIWKQSPLPNDE